MNKKLIISATSKYNKISPSKFEKILKNLRHIKYIDALNILKKIPQKYGTILWKVLNSAANNAKNNFNIEKNQLIINEFYSNLGPIRKKFRPRAKGRTFCIQKKMAHITIKLIKN